MQAVIYIFIVLFGVAFSFVVYSALSFTMIEAMLSGAIALVLAMVIYEKRMRLKAEERLEKGIEELSALLSTDAKAGQILSERLNKITDAKMGDRLEVMEADFSVLGTLVRQVAEAVAQVEETQESFTQNIPIEKNPIINKSAKLKPIASIGDVKAALKDRRISFYAQAIVNLPQRKVRAYYLKAKMEKPNKQIINAEDFIPTRGNEVIVREIEQLGFIKAFNLNNKATHPLFFYIPISKASLNDNDMLNWLIAQLDKSRENAKNIIFIISQDQWDNFNSIEKAKLATLVDKGATISISKVHSLRFNFAELKENGVSSIFADASTFIDNPQKYSDFQEGDVANYIHRYNINLIICNVSSEQQVLTLLDDGIKLIKGDYISPAGLANDVVELKINEET